MISCSHSTLDVTDQDGRDILKQIKRDEGSVVASLSSSAKAIPLNLRKWPPSMLIVLSAFLETVNTCIRYFDTHDDTKKTHLTYATARLQITQWLASKRHQ